MAHRNIWIGWMMVWSVCVIIPSSRLLAQPPSYINYQGRLVDGTNLMNGTVGLTLRLLDAPGGGNLLYADSNQVLVVDGLYSTLVGDNSVAGSLLAALTNNGIWLEVVVNGTTLTPREPIASVAYALTTRGILVTTNNSVIGIPHVNSIHPSTLNAVIGGGNINTIGSQSLYTTIGGGELNSIGTNANRTTIGGGSQNRIGSLASLSTISGGGGNAIGTNAQYASIGGGQNNRIGNNALFATIAGGAESGIGTGSSFSAISGGFGNFIKTNSLHSVIGGGTLNNIGNQADFALISGGRANGIGEGSSHGVIGGGGENTVSVFSVYATIPGGRGNSIGFNSDYNTIGGGYNNTIAVGVQRSIIAGGYNNQVDNSAQYGSLGGGSDNRILNSSQYATVPGGRNNMAYSYSFAAGRGARAIHNGTFVWGDDRDETISSTTSNQFVIRAQNGLGVNVTNIGAGLSADFGNRVRVRGNTPGIWLYDGTLAQDRGFVGAGDGSHIGLYGDHGAGWGLLMNVSNGFIGIGKFFPSNIIDVANGAYLSAGGTWTSVSDVNRKTDFEPVDVGDILDRVAALPITKWSYTAEPGVKHIGPTAQDFHAAFGVGVNDVSLSQIDPDGVALAAIQALAGQMTEIRTQDSEVREEVSVFRTRVSELEEENARLRVELEAIKKKLDM